MIRPSLSSRPWLLGLLAGVASILATQSLLWPRWPAAAPIPAAAIGRALESAGFQAQPLRPLPAHRSFEHSTSPGIGFSIGQGEALRLSRGRVRERLTLQAALFAAADPGFKLQDRVLLAGPPRSALGRISGAPTRQTCLVLSSGGSGGFAVNGEDLLQLVEQQPRSRANRLAALIGLRQPLDYSCVLISASAPPSQGAISEQRWQRLLSTLRKPLEQESQAPSPPRSEP